MRTLALPASALLIGFAAASCGAPRPRLVPPPPISPSIAIVGATLWDGTGRAPVTNAVTVVRGERILCAGAAGECAILQGARVIDGHGRRARRVCVHVPSFVSFTATIARRLVREGHCTYAEQLRLFA